MNRDTARPDKLAKQMFFVGLLGLPWLWVVNIMYFFNRVYGNRIPCCGGDESGPDSGAANEGILGMITNDNEENGGENNGGHDNPPQEQIEEDLKKWVKRSTFGAFISSSLLVSWIIVFQFNRENFGPRWFVYAPSDEILTGW